LILFLKKDSLYPGLEQTVRRQNLWNYVDLPDQSNLTNCAST
jgi:hypothetical protein